MKDRPWRVVRRVDWMWVATLVSTVGLIVVLVAVALKLSFFPKETAREKAEKNFQDAVCSDSDNDKVYCVQESVLYMCVVHGLRVACAEATVRPTGNAEKP